MRLLYISNIPAPYQLELFGHIARAGLAEVRAFFCMWSLPGRGWKRPVLPEGFEVLPHISLQRLYPDLVVNWGIKRRIREFKPDAAIVGSYMVPGLHRAMSVLTGMGVPWLFWEEFHRFSGNPVKQAIRKRLLMGALRRCTAVLGIGRRAVSMFEELTGGTRPVHNFPYASDLRRFMEVPKKPGEGKGVRFLYSGQFIPRKGVDVLVQAFKKVVKKHADCTLMLVGDGPLKPEIEESIPPQLKERVEFTGQLPWEKLAECYSQADVFVMPSRHDGWGMVVPEAMAAGLPVISTKEVGAALDLVEDGKTGFLFDKDDVDALAKHMAYFCEKPEKAGLMGKRAQEAVRYLDVQNAAVTLVGILERTVRNEAPQERRG